MIKGVFDCCAVISRSASVKEDHNHGQFVTFDVTLPVSGRQGEKVDMTIHVSMDGGASEAAIYTTGRRVSLHGTLSPRRKDGKTFFNLRADKIDLANTTDADRLEGTWTFQGKIGKKGVSVRQDSNGKDYKTFSAFSSEKNGDKMEFIWLFFYHYNLKDDESFLAADSFIKATGKASFGVFKNEVSLSCSVSELSRWELPSRQ